jgi:hypothetical protein
MDAIRHKALRGGNTAFRQDLDAGAIDNGLAIRMER